MKPDNIDKKMTGQANVISLRYKSQKTSLWSFFKHFIP